MSPLPLYANSDETALPVDELGSIKIRREIPLAVRIGFHIVQFALAVAVLHI
jgi:hypothetical protein